MPPPSKSHRFTTQASTDLVHMILTLESQPYTVSPNRNIIGCCCSTREIEHENFLPRNGINKASHLPSPEFKNVAIHYSYSGRSNNYWETIYYRYVLTL